MVVESLLTHQSQSADKVEKPSHRIGEMAGSARQPSAALQDSSQQTVYCNLAIS
jgi:hypothetical protein